MRDLGMPRLGPALVATALVWAMPQTPALAQSEPFIGQLMLTPFTFCPHGWAEANGQSMSISQNSALFALIGTTYGGDGRTTFRLPDLRGRAPIHLGQGPGLSNYALGQVGGAETATLTTAQLPTHSHAATTTATLHATDAAGDQNVPTNHVLGDDGTDRIYSAAAPNVTMAQGAVTATTTVAPAGNSQPLDIRGPYLAMRWCIAVQGVFPPRD